MTNLVTTPTLTTSVPQEFVIEPQSGPGVPAKFLDRFPDSLYNKSPESILVKLLFTLMGPISTGYVQKNMLDARLAFESYGVEGFNLDRFYGDPFKFGRILDERYTDVVRSQTTGAISSSSTSVEVADPDKFAGRQYALVGYNDTRIGEIVGVDSVYGNKLTITRGELGSSSQDWSSGVGIYPYVAGSGVVKTQQTSSTEPLSVMANREIIRTQDAKYRNRAITFMAGAHLGPTVNGIKKVAESGLGSETEIIERYKYLFDRYSDMPLGISDVGKTTNCNEVIVKPAERASFISQMDKFYMDSAINRIKPVDVFVTIDKSEKTGSEIGWSKIDSSSELSEAIQFVTGSESIVWPDTDDVHWITTGKEVEAPKPYDSPARRYEFFHKPINAIAYRNGDLNSESVHTGKYSPEEAAIFSVLSGIDDPYEEFSADLALADELSLFRSTSIIPEDVRNGSANSHQIRPKSIYANSYPDTYLSAHGANLNNNIRYKSFWSSAYGQAQDVDYLEVDLGAVRAVNFITLDILDKPTNISIEYDEYGDETRSSANFIEVTKQSDWPTSLRLDPQRGSTWTHLQMPFSDASDNTIFTRYVRVRLQRVENSNLSSWTFQIRGLRLGRIS